MQRLSFASLFIVAAACAAGCGSSDENSDQPCTGSVDAITDIDTGQITVGGNFSEGQPLLVITGDGGSRSQFTPDAGDATYARYIGLPSGTFQAEWLLSCDNGGGQANIVGPNSIEVP